MEVVLMEVVLVGNGTDLVGCIISVVEDSSLTVENASFLVGNGVALLAGNAEEDICESVAGNIMVFVICDGLTTFVVFVVCNGITAFVALIVTDTDEETTKDTP